MAITDGIHIIVLDLITVPFGRMGPIRVSTLLSWQDEVQDVVQAQQGLLWLSGLDENLRDAILGKCLHQSNWETKPNKTYTQMTPWRLRTLNNGV